MVGRLLVCLVSVFSMHSLLRPNELCPSSRRFILISCIDRLIYIYSHNAPHRQWTLLCMPFYGRAKN